MQVDPAVAPDPRLSTSHLGSCKQINCAEDATEAAGTASAAGAVGEADAANAAGAAGAAGAVGAAGTAGVAEAPDAVHAVEAAMVQDKYPHELQHGPSATIGLQLTPLSTASAGRAGDAEASLSTQNATDKRLCEPTTIGMEWSVDRSRGTSAGERGPRSTAQVSRLRPVQAGQQIATGTRDLYLQRSPSAEGLNSPGSTARKAVLRATSLPKDLLTSEKRQPPSSMPRLAIGGYDHPPSGFAWNPRLPASPQNVSCWELKVGAAPSRYGGYSGAYAGGRPGSSAWRPQRGGMEEGRRVLATREARCESPDAKLHRIGSAAAIDVTMQSQQAA